MKNRRRRGRRINLFTLSLLIMLFVSVYSLFAVSHHIAEQRPTEYEQTSQVETEKHSQPREKKQQGRIIIVNMDEQHRLPISDSEFILIDQASNEQIDLLTTDPLGRAVSKFLDYDTKYILKQQRVKSPYLLDQLEYHIEIRERNHEFVLYNQISEFIKAYELGEDGQIRVSEVYIPVETVLQLPELPNGCEITALTAVLNTYGYDVTKLKMADEYLPKEPFTWRNGKLYGPDPYQAYAGEPRLEPGGFFSYAPPIIEAGQHYLADVNGKEELIDLSGSSREELMAYLEQGIPLVVWVTLDLSKARINYSWHIYGTDERFLAPVNLHCVVLHGYADNLVHVMDPLKGLIQLDADRFFASYEDLGSHALAVLQH